MSTKGFTDTQKQELRTMFEEQRSLIHLDTIQVVRQEVRQELEPVKQKLDRIDHRTDEDLRAEAKRIDNLDRRVTRLEARQV